jgi:uncharacterized protein YndB with AHSA1/START domain
MPTVAATRTIGAAPEAVWRVVCDPHHLPRWWPRVARVEGVQERAFTEVLSGKRGKVVRADFDVLEASAGQRVVWSQQVLGTPFERVLRSSVTAIELEPAAAGGAADRRGVRDGGGATDVRIELSQVLTGPGGGGRGALSWRVFGVARFGSPLVRRAAARTVQEALDGLERVLAGGD